MEKVHKNIACLIILLLIFSCKSDKKTTIDSAKLHSEVVDTIKTEKYSKFKSENPNCLKESDSLEIQKFKKQLAEAILKKDTLSIIDFVAYPFMEGMTLKEKKETLKIDFETIMELCLESIMDKYDLEELEGEDYFDEKEGSLNCFTYKINNSFSSREVTHIFIFDKINGEIKLVAIETIG